MKVVFVNLQSDQKSVSLKLACRSASQNSDDFEYFLSNFEFLLQDITLTWHYYSVIITQEMVASWYHNNSRNYLRA